MCRLSRFHFSKFSYLLLSVFLLQLIGNAPVAAQSDVYLDNEVLGAQIVSPVWDENSSSTTNTFEYYDVLHQSEEAQPVVQIEDFNPEPQAAASLRMGETEIDAGDTLHVTASITNTGDVSIPSYVLQITLTDGLAFQRPRDSRKTIPLLEPSESYEWVIPIRVTSQAEGLQIISIYGNRQNSPTIDTHVSFLIEPSGNVLIMGNGPTLLATQSPYAPESWAPKFTEPEISLFSGAATYSYSFDVIPGRNGLQPSLALSYNSRNSDGISYTKSSGDYYEGWNLTGMAYISRKGVQGCLYSSDHVVVPDNYILSLNGQTYPLEKVGTTTTPYGRYAAKGGPNLYVARYNDLGGLNGGTFPGSSVNVTGEYWIVKTTDGTWYRFGYDADSEQVMARLGGQDEACQVSPAYTGRKSDVAVLRWLLDRVEDPSGNFMEYTYKDSPGYESSVCEGGTCREIMEYLDRIEYNNTNAGVPGNYLSKISFSWVSGNNLCVTGSCGNHNLTITAGKYQLSTISVLHNDQIKWTYQLQGSVFETYGDNHRITKLDNITKLFPGESLASTVTPPVSFTYTTANEMYSGHRSHCWDSNHEDFDYPYLRRIDNGYGATFEFSYSSSTFLKYTGGGDCSQGATYNNVYGLSHFVTGLRTWDGVQNIYGLNPATTWQLVSYSPADACFSHYDPFYYNGTSYVNVCQGDGEFGSTLVGFYKVRTEIRTGSNTAILSRTDTEFYKQSNGALLLGTPKYQYTYDPSDLTYTPLVTKYWERVYASNCSNGDCPNTGLSAFWALLYREQTIQFDPTSGASTETWIVNQYLPQDQGSVTQQWGQLTRQTEISGPYATGTVLRRSINFYIADTADWLLFPWYSGVWNGSGTQEQVSISLYDSNTNPDNQSIDRGDKLRWSRIVLVGDNTTGTVTWPSIDTFYEYNSFGLPNKTTTYNKYGTITVNLNANPDDWQVGILAKDVTGAVAATTQTEYSANGLTISWVQSALGTTDRTNLAYGDNRFPWAVTSITDPNGVKSTYSYDLAGRLLTVKESNPSAGIGEFTAVSYTYSFVDPPGSINKMLQIDETVAPNNNDIKVTNRRFFDGLGRVVQERKFNVAIDGTSNTVVWQESYYDALGRQTCQIHPDSTNTTQYYLHQCTDYPNTRTTYDVLGRPLIVTAPDGSQTYSLTTGLTTFSFDAKNHMTVSKTDPFGRLVQVREMHNVYDAFAGGAFDADTVRWTRNTSLTQITELNGDAVLAVQGTGYWANWGVVRENQYTIEPGQSVFLRFRFADEEFAGRLGLLTDKGGFIGIISHVDTLYPDYNIGGSDVGIGSVAIPRDDNVWYRAKIDIDVQGRVTWFVWQEDDPFNPNKHFYYTLDTSASRDFYDDASFKFYIHSGSTSGTSTVYLSDYQKGSLLTTSYEYDPLDNLTKVIDTQNHQTLISYDALGRKTDMTDPDMGTWSYEYDPAGNLVEQADANGNSLCFSYDKLNRILSKEIGSFPCPGTQILANYTYDTALNGMGQLHTVSWGANLEQNKDTFSYDALGRMYKQDRLVNGRPYTLQTLSYDPLNRPLQVQYPNGEILTVTYDREGENSLAAGSDTLITDVRYNAMGQLTYVDRYHAGGFNLDTQFKYFGTANNFRLEKIINGTETTTPSTGDNRPDFTYQYDSIGNILSIVAGTNNYGIDTQAFTYDSLNRLTTAVSTSGVADYNHTYNYDAIGNIISIKRGTATTTYGYHATKVHAVISAGSYSFGYDGNGNMINRQDGTGTYTQIFDVENRLTVVNKNGGGVTTFYYDASGQRVRTIEPDGTIIYTPFPGYEEEISSEGYHWTFDEGSGSTIGDSSFNEFNGTRQGPQWTTGYYGQALDFDGVNDYVQFNGTIEVAGGLTVSAWVRPEAVPTGLGRLIVSTYKYNADSTKIRGWALGDEFGDVDQFQFRLLGTDGSTAIAYSNGFFNQYLNQWVHVTGVFRPGEAVELYINGQLVNSDTTNVPAQIGQSNLFEIGSRADNTTQGFWDGQIDEVRVIPRALASTEISGLMAANLPGSSGSTVLAQSGNGAGGTLAATSSEQAGSSLFALTLLGVFGLLLPVGFVQTVRKPKNRVWLQLRWRRHRLLIGKVVSLVSLMGLLANSVFLVPGVQAMPAAAPLFGPVQSPWLSTDIGSVGVPGSADETSGVFTIDGSGTDIGGTADAFHYVYQTLAGDGTIIARVASQTTPNFWSRSGLMMRESLDANAPHVMVAVMSQANRVQTFQRSSINGTTTTFNGGNGSAPKWLKLERVGSTITSFRSEDGLNWTQLESLSTSMNGTIYVGMAVTSRNNSTVSTAIFDNVSVAGGGGGPTATPTATNTVTPTATATVPTVTATATSTATMTPSPTPTLTPSPTPQPAQPEVIVQRTTYSIAGQAVFLRIRTLEDGVEVDKRLYAMHTDHLGSTSTLSYLDPVAGTAYQVEDARALYEPFGDYRLEPTGEYTDRGYTGHLGNNSGSNDIGLIYMNARFYVPGIARFASADTIVPDPASPQSFNRYSYTYNNPLNHIDPDGHDPHWCNGDPICVNSYVATTMSINKKSDWENLPLAGSEEFSSWNEGKHSGCTMCHAAAGTQFTALTNEQLDASLDQMHDAAFQGTVAAGIGTTVGYAGYALIPAACADGDCINEMDQLNRAYGMSSDQIHELKNLNVYNQFNALNNYMSYNDLRTVMFNMSIDAEMIATSGAPKWQTTMGLIKHSIDMGLTSELYQEIITVNPYLIQVLDDFSGGG